MHDFELFRVAGWIDDDGLLKRFDVIASEFAAGLKAAAIAAAACAATVLSVHAHASNVAWPPNIEAQQDALLRQPAEVRVARLDAAMSNSIARFMSSDQSDLDSRLVQAAADLLRTVKFPTQAK